MHEQRSPPQLIQEVASDQRQRWQGGDRVSAEWYLEKYPELRQEADCAVEVIYDEFLLRQELGETPRPEEYLRRFPGFAAQLRLLFDVDGMVDDLLQTPTDAPPPAEAPEAGAWPVVAGYEIFAELGRGGMGVVYKARQLRPDRLVALKMVLIGGHASEVDLVRFRAEAEAVARLQHPHVVQVYEVGEQNGLPFYSMEFVDGGSLAEQLRGTPLSAQQAAQLVATLARTMHFVHQRALIHRDLKPANILLSVVSGQSSVVERERGGALQLTIDNGQLTTTPKITDFGLAKRLDAGTGPTQTGAILGTPSYMAPEQVHPRDGKVGPAADIYAMGAILYETLTGRPPFKAETPVATLRQVLEEEPAPARLLNPQVPRDLETVCLKCLHKQPAQRYESAAALADDLERWLRGEPVRARRSGPGERALKWARRRPALAAMTALCALLALGGVTGVFSQWLRAEAAYQTEREEKRQKEQALAAETKLRQELEEALAKVEINLHVHRVARADHQLQDGRVALARQSLQECLPKLRGWEADYLTRLCQQDLRTLTTRSNVMDTSLADRRVAFSPDGRHLVLGGSRTGGKLFLGQVTVWETATGRELPSLGGHSHHVLAVVFSPDGRLLATASADQTIKLWSWPDRTLRHSFDKQPAPVTSLAFSPDGRRLASAGTDKTARIWDVAGGQQVHRLPHPGPVWSVAYHPYRPHLVTASGERDKPGSVMIWDAEAGREVHTLPHVAPVRSVAYSPDGRYLASAGGELKKLGEVKVWKAATGEEVRPLSGHTDLVSSVVFLSDGRLASAGHDGMVKVWDVATGRAAITFKGHPRAVQSVAVSADGQRLASADEERTVKLWDAATDPEALVVKGPDRTGPRSIAPLPVVFSPDGKLLASAAYSDKVRGNCLVKVWDVTTGRVVRTLDGHTGDVASLAFSPDGRRLASAGHDGTVKVWKAATGGVALHFAPKGASPVWCVAFHPNGKLLASASKDKVVRIWDASAAREGTIPEPLRVLDGHTDVVRGVAFNHDGTRLASASEDRTVKVWDLANGRELHTLKGHNHRVWCVAFSPDGKRLASGSATLAGDEGKKGNEVVGGEVRVWDADSGAELRTLHGHTSYVSAVTFSPDGRRLVSASHDETVKVWETGLGLEALTLKGHAAQVAGVVFSPDGRLLASTARDGTVRLWDARPLTDELRVEREAAGLVRFLLIREKDHAAEIEQRIRDHLGISEAVRQQALAMLQRLRELQAQ